MKVSIDLVTARLRAPFVSARGTVRERELLLLRLTDAGGLVGAGEAAPLQDYDGVGIDGCRAALEDCRDILGQADGYEREVLLEECRRRAVLPQAVAAVDLALWDLAGRRAGHPVFRLLDGASPGVVDVNYTIAAADRAGAASEAAWARQAGYGTLKLKVGIGDDGGRLAAARAAAGPRMQIRLDANGAWSVDEAAAALRALAPGGIELCEEPVHGVEDFASLNDRTPVPLALDETAAAPGALDHRVAAAVCLKISGCGGITGLLDAARRARAVGYEVYLASTLDGPLGIAAALHAAAALAPDRPCGLATLPLFDAADDPLPPRHGRIGVPESPGLGDGLLGWYRR